MENLTTLLLFAVGVLTVNAYWTKNRSRVLPPGPKGWPIIGNVLDMPATFEWITFHQWAKQFSKCLWTEKSVKELILMLMQSESDVIYCNVFGINIVILDSMGAVNELLEKRSAIYSSRYADLIERLNLVALLNIQILPTGRVCPWSASCESSEGLHGVYG